MNNFFNITLNLVVFMLLEWGKGFRNHPTTPPVKHTTEALL